MTDESPLPPDWSKAEIAELKVRDYLLNLEHKDGRSKAIMFLRLGFTLENWSSFVAAVRKDHVGKPSEKAASNNFGVKYALTARLFGPAGSAMVRSVWIVHNGENIPRLITAYPVKQNV